VSIAPSLLVQHEAHCLIRRSQATPREVIEDGCRLMGPARRKCFFLHSCRVMPRIAL
jgi:hypothetical protein